MDRTADSGKSRGGVVCVMVNSIWCNNGNVVTLACSCSPNLELLALKFHPFYLSWEFTLVIVIVDKYKSVAYGVCKAVREAKRCYGRKLETQFQQSGSRSLWQALWMITDYRSPPSGLMSADESLVNELNTFFARFEATSSSANANSASANNANGAIGAANGKCAEPTIEQRPLTITDIIPSSFKRSTIFPIANKPRPSGLNDYRPVALTSVVMKCFEKLVRDFITSSLPDPLQFAYRHNRSTDDATAHLLHTTLTHLDKGRGNYVKMLFVDYSSAFNTIIHSQLTTKLEGLGLHTSLCDWISNFLTDRPQSVWVGNCVSSTLTLSTGAPQGCVLSSLLYSLYTYDCAATSSSNIIVKFTDDSVVMGLISDNDERAYLEEIKHLENWCQGNNFLLNISKTKELIVDYSKKQERHYQPVRINGTMVERIDSFRYCGLQTALEDTGKLLHLHFLHTVWFGNNIKQDGQALQRVVRSAELITHMELPDLQTIYYKRCQTKARRIVKDPTHPNNRLFSLLRSGKRFHSLKTNTKTLKRSFFPQAIWALNHGN
ncbi:hypothetical protein P4O66_004990 [Electrophorus voltai]|uniref:Reverse transcriptase domain-containing protein n=1 Tax=Electrophorus voltai TaxID=2609070 RepID=A0AAD8ZWA9_9TELE|nr:hypothetical protein P4O66_004990 [Electrophorus voltai]